LAGGTGTPGQIKVTDTQAVSATIVNAGGSGTPGPAVVIGTTGSGPTLFQLNVTIGVGGSISSINSVAVAGDYVTDPTDITNEPVADNSSSGITGAVVSVQMGALAATVVVLGAYTVTPTNPVAQASSTGSGTGATWNVNFSPPITLTDGAGGLPLTIDGSFINAGNGNVILSGVMKPLPAPPWTITVATSAFVIMNSNGQAVFPLFFYDSVTSKTVSFAWLPESGSNGELVHFVAVPIGQAITPASMSLQNSAAALAWWRVQNDGTNLTFWFSPDGVTGFAPNQFFHQESVMAYTPNAFDFVGVGVNRSWVESQPTDGYLGSAISLWNFTQTSP
jgi:hypothetical protein